MKLEIGNLGKYYYLFNAQGDVIGIIDSNGTQVVGYAYDAWGDILSITGTKASTIGQLNPIRYRGYYYDAETGFYYLQSRYYDPEICRFINADGYVSTGQGILGTNMYAYCGNDPANMCDCTGACPHNGNIVELYSKSCLFCNFPFKTTHNSFSSQSGLSLKSFYNADGSWAFYDNHRHNPDNIFHEQLLVIDGGIAADVSNEGLSVDASATLITGGWEWDNVDLSLLDFGRASIALGLSDEVIGAQAIAVIWDPSIAFNIGSKTVEISVYVGGFGGEFAYVNGKFNAGYAAPWGFGLSIY